MPPYYERDERDERSEFGGDGKQKRRALRESYNPPYDAEGATWEGLEPVRRRRRWEDD